MAPSAASVFPLAECHESILQRIVDLSDASDLFLLRQVSRRFRDAVGRRIRRIRPDEALAPDFADKFPNLVSLDLRDLRDPDDYDRPLPGLPAQLAAIVPRLPHLRELLDLELSNADEAVEWGPILRQLTHLRAGPAVIELDTEELVVQIAPHCCSLQQLSFNYVHYTTLHEMVPLLPASLTGLAGTIEDYDDKDEALLPLNTGRLQTLRLSEEGPQRAASPQLAAFTSLFALELKLKSFAQREDLSVLASLTRLTSLRLCKASSGQGVASLTRLSRLAELHLTDFTPEPVDALGTFIAGFPSLTSLNVDRPGEAVFRSSLCGLTRLTRLSAKSSTLIGEPRALRGLSQLRQLDLRSSLRAESQLRHLSDLVSLTWLDLSGSGCKSALSHKGLSWLTRMTALELLFLEDVHSFKGSAFKQLAQLPALRELDLSCRQRSELPSLAPLERLEHLQWLRLPDGYELVCQLPPRLAVPAMKGRRWWGPGVYADPEGELRRVVSHDL